MHINQSTMRRSRISCCCSSLFFFFFFLLSWPACSVSSGELDTLSPDRPLLDDGATALVSSGGSFRLGFFSPNGSTNRYVGIWYNNISIQTVVWVANRRYPITTISGNLSLTTNGTLIITGEDNSTVLWSSGLPTATLRNPVARLLDDGNFVIQEAAGSNGNDSNSFAWQSFYFPTDTQLPGMALGQKKLDTGIVLNVNLTAWKSPTDPAPGQYAFGLDMRGDPQEFIWSDTRPYWRGGPWNGRWISGVLTDGADGVISFNFDDDHTNYRPVYQSSTIVRWTMNSSGQLQLLVWAEDSWIVSWYIPKDRCDQIFLCGPNSYCSSNISPPCTCLPAFHPRNQRNWDMLDGSDGCIRTTPLDCLNNTDGFFTQSGTKLPDTSRSTVLANLSLEGCRALCLSNCSCTAYAVLDISTGSGCLIWTEDLTDMTVYQSGLGQDLYVRLAAADLASASEALHHHSDRNILLIVVLLPLSILLFLACVAYSIWRWKKKRSSQIHYEAEEKVMELPLFDLNAIKDATDDFSPDNKLGEGGFGPVYKGELGEEQEIAVKRLSQTSTQGVVEFKNEITLIAKLQHRNLVKLLGCCIQGGERLLIYEYMPNGSLDTILFCEAQTVLLDWRARYNIILGVARGLFYLHHDSRLRIVHRDLKASNILLDKDMNPKISDFGMARIFGGDESESITKRVVGTYGYMSPEYVMDGIFSIKSDVFSFGILILEIISGKRNRDAGQSMSQLILLGNMWIMWKEGKCLDLVDTNFSHLLSENEVLRCIKVGLLCVQKQPEDRPTMSSVLAMLVSVDNISLLPEPKEPGFFISRLSSVSSDFCNRELVSVNQVSITEIAGR